MPQLLVVDDDPGVQYALGACWQTPELEISRCGSVREALHLVPRRSFDVVILDVGVAGGSALDAFDQISEQMPRLPVILVSALAKTETAIEAMQRGAFEYLVKPVDSDRLRTVVARAIEVTRLSRSTDTQVDATPNDGDGAADTMIGQSPPMQEVYKSIGRVASQDVAVLIEGESGTGKELVARAIGRYSSRLQKPFVAINCAAIPETLLESQLFGYEKGAFTGADQRRIGKFEYANGGTVFLDEIGDMSSATQAKVLRLIQEQRFERIGGTETVQTDVRVIAATNKSLIEMVGERTFRQDLYYRINGFAIELPPLRKRHGDIPLLARHFIQRFNREMGKTVQAVAPDAMQWLETHPWPGNVRELQSTIKYAMIKAAGDVLTLGCFPLNSPSPKLPDTGLVRENGEFPVLADLARRLFHSSPGNVYRQLVSDVDKVVLDEALRYANGNQLHAAALLGISRTTLRAKLRSLGLSVEKQLSTERGSKKQAC